MTRPGQGHTAAIAAEKLRRRWADERKKTTWDGWCALVIETLNRIATCGNAVMAGALARVAAEEFAE